MVVFSLLSAVEPFCNQLHPKAQPHSAKFSLLKPNTAFQTECLKMAENAYFGCDVGCLAENGCVRLNLSRNSAQIQPFWLKMAEFWLNLG